jgi:hypothetical protein
MGLASTARAAGIVRKGSHRCFQMEVALSLGSSSPSPRYLLPRLPSSLDNRDRLRRALFDVLAKEPEAIAYAGLDGQSSAGLRRLRAFVGIEVQTLRAQGLPPERMLVEMKDLVLPVLAMGRVTRHAYGALMLRIVRWCAEAYYAGSA